VPPSPEDLFIFRDNFSFPGCLNVVPGVDFPHLAMRVLVISDIHANLHALDAVLADAGDFEAVWCLGDLVGYGPNPNECVARIRDFPELLSIAGNHDRAAIGDLDLDAFNGEARRALEWTHKALSPESIEYLHALPEQLTDGSFTLVHGSPRRPL
jgi:predicted phosphodiesterase